MSLFASKADIPSVDVRLGDLTVYSQRTLIVSESSNAIDRTATIHRSSRGHRSRHRPRYQHDAGSCDATNRITNVFAVHYGSGFFSAGDDEPRISSVNNAIESFICAFLHARKSLTQVDSVGDPYPRLLPLRTMKTYRN